MKLRPLPNWESLATADFGDACEVLASAGTWQELGAPHGFLVPFAREDAWLTRKQAMLDLFGRNHLRERFVADAIETLREIGQSREKHWRMHTDTCRRFLSCWMLEASPADLRKLAKFLEGKPTKGKGGPESPRGEVWTAFCLFAVNHRRLPTVAELRRQTGFRKGSNAGDKHFADYVKELGLEGLENPPER
jgi:hypothetical protein